MSESLPLRLGEKLLQHQHLSRFQLRQALILQRQHPQRLGELLTELGYIPGELIEQAARLPAPPDPGPRLGEVLVSQGWLSPQQLAEALAEQQASEEELGTLLLRKNWLDPLRLEQALAQQLLSRHPARKRRLGEILAQTRQISGWQLKLALKLKQALRNTPLGELLVRLNWLHPDQLRQALRLQKRLLRSATGLSIGMGLLISCKAPTVPLQFLDAGNLSRISSQAQYQTQNQMQQAIAGPFKTLAVGADRAHQINIRVYQNGSRLIENVPYFTQGNDNTCGQAVIAMLTNFWGVTTSYQALVNTENPLNLATTAGAMVNSLRKKGLSAQDFRDASLENLVAEINKGRPAAVLLDFGSIQQAHYVIIVGYNPKRKTLIMHDSLEAPYVEMPQQIFVKMWENKSIRSILPVGGSNYRRLMFTTFHTDASQS